MKAQFAHSLTVMKLIALIDLGMAVLIAIICWFAGWRSVSNYGMALILGGGLLLGLSGISAMGSSAYITDPTYLLARSVENKPLHQRMGEDLKYIRDSWNSMTLMALISLGLISLGLAVMMLGNLFH
jgi:hypothetical protein